MKATQKLSLYRERLSKWLALCVEHPSDLSHRNLCKPKPEDFGITNSQELFVAKSIHDTIVHNSP